MRLPAGSVINLLFAEPGITPILAPFDDNPLFRRIIRIAVGIHRTETGHSQQFAIRQLKGIGISKSAYVRFSQPVVDVLPLPQISHVDPVLQIAAQCIIRILAVSIHSHGILPGQNIASVAQGPDPRIGRQINIVGRPQFDVGAIIHFHGGTVPVIRMRIDFGFPTVQAGEFGQFQTRLRSSTLTTMVSALCLFRTGKGQRKHTQHSQHAASSIFNSNLHFA